MLSQSNVEYEADFNLWIEQTVALLRARRFEEIDLDALIDELESMSKRDKREILSRLKVLLMHLLKWHYQSSHRGSWKSSIRNNQEEIQQIIADSPSLQNYPALVLAKAYASARQSAASETGLPIDAFPEQCPFSIETVLEAMLTDGVD